MNEQEIMVVSLLHEFWGQISTFTCSYCKNAKFLLFLNQFDPSKRAFPTIFPTLILITCKLVRLVKKYDQKLLRVLKRLKKKGTIQPNK